MKPKFKPLVKGISVQGDLWSSFAFTSEKEATEWLNVVFPQLKAKYKNLTYHVYDLPGFKAGDTCCVNGEGYDVFVIEKIVQIAPFKYSALLDSGWREEINKCFKR